MIASYPQVEYIYTRLHENSFWGKKQLQTCKNMLYAQLEFLKQTGRYDCFKLDKSKYSFDEKEKGIVHLFWDSDVYKYIEGACYYLRQKHDPIISEAVNEMVDSIAAAQQIDGYINVHFTMCAPQDRWKNIRDHHELYSLGHLIEAAIAHQLWVPSGKLLLPAISFVNYAVRTFGPATNQKHAYPGHPEIELALCRLHEFADVSSHLELAKYFITERGKQDENGLIYYDYEAQRRGNPVNLLPGNWPQPRSYFTQQAHLPILEQNTIEGHSVRAMYLLTGVVDLSRITNNKEYLKAAKVLWSDMINNKMYVTGGIGSVDQWEGFDHLQNDLPQCPAEGGCYAETCASIGVVMLAHRFLQVETNHEYGDILDLALFNTVLGSFNETGTAFTYCNTLASDSENPCERDPKSWYACCCCPPNILRTINIIGGYLWDYKESGNIVRIHSFTGMNMSSPLADVSMETEYPYSGKIKLDVHLRSSRKIKLLIRIPGWAQSDYLVDGERPKEVLPANGYLTIEQASGKYTVDLNIKPRLIFPHYLTGQNVVGVAYGPLTYCLEDIDNFTDDHFRTTGLDIEQCELEVMPMKNGIVPIKAVNAGRKLDLQEERGPLVDQRCCWSGSFDLIFVPFYYRGNRSGGQKMMRTLLRIVEGHESAWVTVDKSDAM